MGRTRHHEENQQAKGVEELSVALEIHKETHHTKDSTPLLPDEDDDETNEKDANEKEDVITGEETKIKKDIRDTVRINDR